MDARLKDRCDTASSQIRFSHDREAVRRELADHLEDHCDALAELDYDPGLAAERTLAAMGDAEEVGKALNRQHSPLLGWAWLLSRAALAGVVFAMLVQAIMGGLCTQERFAYTFQKQPMEQEWQHLDENYEWYGAGNCTLLASTGGETAEFGDYIVEAPKVLWWHTYDRTYLVSLRLTVRPKNPFCGAEVEFPYHLNFTDSAGDIIANTRDEKYLYEPCEMPFATIGSGMTGIFQTDYDMELQMENPVDWVELSYPNGDGAWTLRLERGAGQ